jgi:hypothetical protein
MQHISPTAKWDLEDLAGIVGTLAGFVHSYGLR